MGKELNLLDIAIVIARHKGKVAINFIAISIFAFIFAVFILPKTYKSEVVFIPKGQSGSGLFSLIGNNFSADIIGGSKLSKRQYTSLLYSRELREKLIEKFNLIKVYKKTKAINPLDQTLKVLKHAIVIEEAEEGGLGITDIISITITIFDQDPVRASEMANYLFYLLEEKTNELNRKEYEEITDFLSVKINECNHNLDSVRTVLSEFQITNHVYDIPQQVSMVLQAFSFTKAEIFSLENQINYMKSIHDKDYNGIGILEQKKATFEKKLRDMEYSNKKDVFFGLTQSLGISNEYVDLYAEVETYTQLRYLLTQQLEQARIKQSKDFSPLYLIDTARPAEYKYKPKRSLVILGIVSIYMSLFIFILLIWNHYDELRNTNPERLKKIDTFLQQLSFKKK